MLSLSLCWIAKTASFPICLAYKSIRVRRPSSTSDPIPFSGLCLIMDPCQWCHMVMVDTHTSLCHHLSSFLVITCVRASELHSSIDRILQTTSVPSVDCSFILEWVDCLFQDSDAWPASRSLYYFSVLPSFFPCTLNQSQIHFRSAHECHVFSIRLAAHWRLRSGLLPVALFVLN